jgi:hypothetical protein
MTTYFYMPNTHTIVIRDKEADVIATFPNTSKGRDGLAIFMVGCGQDDTLLDCSRPGHIDLLALARKMSMS